MGSRIQTPAGATEVLERRTQRSKTFVLPDGKHRCVSTIDNLHVPSSVPDLLAGNPVTWDEPDTDLTLDPATNVYRINKAWYDLEVKPDAFEFIYTSKHGGSITVSLSKLAGLDVTTLPVTFAPKLISSGIVFEDVLPGLDIALACTPDGLHINKTIKDAAAPRTVEWSVVENDFSARAKWEATGRDNDDEADSARGALPLKRQRTREVQTQTTLGSVTRNGKEKTYSVVNEWTGQTLSVDSTTRQKALSADVVYPVRIDPHITESIGADADDGYMPTSGTWTATENYYGDMLWVYYGRFVGWRFQTVTIPASATIDLATLVLVSSKVNVANTSFAKIYGNDVDDAPVFSGSNLPSAMSKTAASYTVPNIATTGTKTYTITSIIAEIIARGGWVSGNDLALAMIGTPSTPNQGETVVYFDGISAHTSNRVVAVLEIDYTASGGAATLPKSLIINQAVHRAASL